jgi:hypothetical protein
MQWSEVTKRPPLKTLRQFAGLWLVFFVGTAAWRAWHGHLDLATALVGVLGVGVGGVGLWRPAAIRYVFTGWMVGAFPIGWTVSRLMLAAMFYLIFTPVACVFRLIGRDALRLRPDRISSYWISKANPADVSEYFRQS